MTAGDGDPSQPPRSEVIEFGSARHGGVRWLPRLVLAGLVAAALILVGYHPAGHRPTHAGPVHVTSVGHPIMGVRAGWELFGLASSNEVVAVQFARGLITRTVLPQPEAAGQVSFIVGPHDVIVRPLTSTPGYLVPDGLPARPLTGLLASGGLLLPGPAPGQEWFVDGVHTVTLVGLRGQGTSVSIAAAARRLPAEPAMADGRGGVLLLNDSGVLYDAGPGVVRRVGMLLAAVGPRSWLGLSCQNGMCHNVVIDVTTGKQRTLPGAALPILDWPYPAQPGVVSPDGAYAAVMVTGGAPGVALALVDLHTGTASTLPITMGYFASSQTLAWSPDSKWLFVITATGGLAAVSPADRSVRSLGARLPDLRQIAMRMASS